MKSRTPSLTIAALLGGLLLTNPASAVTNSWNGAGVNDNWSTSGNWSLGTPGTTDQVEFNDTDATGTSGPLGTPNNIVSSSTTIQTLKYGNSNGLHTTQISAGATLTIGGSQSPVMLVGTDTDAGGVQTVYATILGQGSLFVTNGVATSIFSVRQGSATSGAHRATLDMEGLDNFTAHVGRIWVAGDNGSSGSPQLNRSQGTLVLARTNFIFCRSTVGNPGILLAETAANGGTCFLKLGQTNVIFSDAGITIGGRKSINSTLTFNASFTSPGALFRNAAGTGRQAFWTVGDEVKQTSSTSTASGAIDFSNGTVDALITTNIVGRGSSTGGSVGTGTGTLTFTAGTIDATTLIIGSQPAGGGGGIGTVNVNGTGLLVAGSVLRLAEGAASSGTLNITGGTVRANAIENGGGATVANITMTGGTLSLTNTAGSSASRILNFTAADSTLNLPVSAAVTNIFVNTLTASGSSTNNTINIVSLPTLGGYPAQFPLISYVSYGPGLTDFLVGSLPAGSPAFQGYISNNVANSTIDLVITSGPTPSQVLTWNGNVNGNWDTTTTNWLNASLAPVSYVQNDFVTFDDSASGTTNVNLTTVLTPSSLTFSNSTKNYALSGSGSIDGNIGITKDGSGSLTLGNSGVNTFSNGVSILGGTVKLSGSADRLPTGSTVTLADVSGAALDLNNLNQTLRSLNGGGASGGNVSLGSGSLTIWSGGGYGGVISGTGQLIKTNYEVSGFLTLSNANTYSGGTIIGGYTNTTTLIVANATGSGTGSGFVRVLTNGSLRIGSGGAEGSVSAAAITNDGTVRVNLNYDLTFPHTLVGAGNFEKFNTNNTVTLAGINSYSGTTLVQEGGLRLESSGAVGSGTITLGNGATTVLQLTNDVSVTSPLTIQSKPAAAISGVANVQNIGGSNTLAGPISLSQNGTLGWMFEVVSGHLLVAGTHVPLTPAQTSQTTTKPLWLRGDADGEWSSSIVDSVNSVTNLAVRKSGLGKWVLSGNNTYTGGTVVSNGTLIVNGSIAAAGSVNVAGGTLGGTGIISGPVTVGAAGTLAPGSSIGTLTVSNGLTLDGTTIMEVTHSSADKVAGIGNLTLNGTLTVVTNGTLLGGEVFQLFSATNYSGDFTTYDLPVLPSPLGWDASLVPVSGTLSVTGAVAVPNPIPLSVAKTNNVLTFSWTDAAFKLQSQTNVLSVGLKTNWVDYPGGGSSPVNVTIDSAKPAVFFRLIAP